LKVTENREVMSGVDDEGNNHELARTTARESASANPSSSPSNSNVTPSSTAISEDDLNRVKAELANNLEEESMLLSLQMQLTVQLEELKKAISTAETEERLATLALQQAKVTRLLQSGGTEEDEEELVTVQVQS
jgi:hypothetical protein